MYNYDRQSKEVR